jgi:hypothetical protein
MLTLIVVIIIVGLMLHLAGGARSHRRQYQQHGAHPNLYYTYGRGCTDRSACQAASASGTACKRGPGSRTSIISQGGDALHVHETSDAVSSHGRGAGLSYLLRRRSCPAPSRDCGSRAASRSRVAARAQRINLAGAVLTPTARTQGTRGMVPSARPRTDRTAR